MSDNKVLSDVLRNASAALNVDLGAIIHNYTLIKSQSSTAECAAVVKANAYGLGMDVIAPTLYNKTGCNTFFVANLVEAVKLHAILPTAIIYVFNGLFEDQIETYVENNIRPILSDPGQIELWNGKKEACAIHFDTGINRLGLSEQQAEEFLNGSPDLNLSLVMSHLVRSEEKGHPTNAAQLNRFKKITDELSNIPASLSNSGGVFLGPEYHFDLLRPGIMLYGGNPGLPQLPSGIKNAVEVKGKILQIRHLEIGETVGYNAIWKAERPSKIAVINVGYADGQLKVADLKTQVFVAGHHATIVGKTSMDMVAVDITGPEFDQITIKDEVELIGTNITLEMACEVSTLGQYEILTGIGQRYAKTYKSL